MKDVRVALKECTFQFFLRMKNLKVALGPIVSATPHRNMSCSSKTQLRGSYWGSYCSSSYLRVYVCPHISHCQQASIKEEQKPHEGEDDPDGRQADANFCT